MLYLWKFLLNIQKGPEVHFACPHPRNQIYPVSVNVVSKISNSMILKYFEFI